MARPVLGNDPFKRGAAPPSAAVPTPTAASPSPAPSKSRKPAAKRPVAPAKSGAHETHRHPAEEAIAHSGVEARQTPESAPRAPEAASSEALPEPLRPPSTRAALSDGLEMLRALPAWLARTLGETARGIPVGPAIDGMRAALLTGLGMTSEPDLAGKLQPWMDFFYSRYFRVTVEGAHHLPQGGCLLVGNHAGVIPIDGWMVCEAVVRERPDLMNPRWLVEEPFLDAPFFGALYRGLGALPTSPEEAQGVLSEGRPVVVFPEGLNGTGKSFSRRYQLQRFGRGGFVKLALRAGVKIVPVAIVGSEETFPLLGTLPLPFGPLPFLPIPASALPLPVKWTLSFGEPLDLEGLDESAADQPGTVERLMDRTRRTLQTQLDATLQKRTSVFLG